MLIPKRGEPRGLSDYFASIYYIRYQSKNVYLGKIIRNSQDMGQGVCRVTLLSVSIGTHYVAYTIIL